PPRIAGAAGSAAALRVCVPPAQPRRPDLQAGPSLRRRGACRHRVAPRPRRDRRGSLARFRRRQGAAELQGHPLGSRRCADSARTRTHARGGVERAVESGGMQLFDTARQEVVPFEPRGDKVGIYVCGITPYDSAHLGHAFVYHVFDVLHRRFRDAGLSVRSVRNVTDVDDDILRVARERRVDFRELATEQVRMFDHDMSEIGLLPVDVAPRATEHVGEMVDWITRLVDGGYAYPVGG